MRLNRFEQYPRATLIAVNLLLLVVSIVAFELILRFRDPTALRRVATAGRLIQLAEHPPNTVWFVEPYGVEIADTLERKQYRLAIDENGYVTPSELYDDPDIVMLFLGGSTTETMFVEEESRFPYLVGRLLETADIRINAYNAGRAASNSQHSLNILLNKGLALEPDIVFMMHNVNDLGVHLAGRAYVEPAQLVPSERSPQSHIYRGFRAFFRQILPNTTQVVRGVWQRYQFWQRDAALTVSDESTFRTWNEAEITAVQAKFAANLRTFVAICRAHDIEPVLMTQPNRITAEPNAVFRQAIHNTFQIEYADYRDLYLRFNETVRAVADEQDVVLIDLAADIPQSEQYIYDWVHLNTVGSELVAEKIATAVRDSGKLGSLQD